MEGVADIHNQVALFGDEVELGGDVAVDTLTSLTTNGDDRRIGTLNLLVDGDRSNGNLGIFLLAHHLGLEPFCRMTLCLEFYSCIGDVFVVDVCEGLRRADAGVLKTFEHINHIRRMHTTGTCTTREEVV